MLALDREDAVDGSSFEKSALALGSSAAGMMLSVLRFARTLALASADIHDAAELSVIGVASAFLLISVLILPAKSPD